VALAAQTKHQAVAHRKQMASLPPSSPAFVGHPSPSRTTAALHQHAHASPRLHTAAFTHTPNAALRSSRPSSTISSPRNAQRDPSEMFSSIYGLPYTFEAPHLRRCVHSQLRISAYLCLDVHVHDLECTRAVLVAKQGSTTFARLNTLLVNHKSCPTERARD